MVLSGNHTCTIGKVGRKLRELKPKLARRHQAIYFGEIVEYGEADNHFNISLL